MSFYDYLHKYASRDTSVRAALRKSLREKLGQDVSVFKIVEPFVGNGWQRDSYYLAAQIFSLLYVNGSSKGKDSFVKALKDQSASRPTIEKKFEDLLKSDDLELFQRKIIDITRLLSTPVDIDQLLTDIKKWESPNSRKKVKIKWAKEFWS